MPMIHLPSLRSLRVNRLLVALAFTLWLLPSAVPAQVSALKKILETSEPGKEAVVAEKPEQIRARIDQWRKDARETLDQLDAPGAAAALPQGVASEELEARRRDLEQMQLITTRLVKSLSTEADARKSADAARGEEVAWKGFPEPPPYSILMLDALLNDQDALKANLVTYEAALSNYQSLLSNVLGEAKASEETVHECALAVQKADVSGLPGAQWRMETARARSRLHAARAELMQSRCDVASDQIATVRAQLALSERKIQAVRSNVRFSDADLTKLKKASDERKAAMRKESAAVAKRLKAAIAAREQAQAAIAGLSSTDASSKDPDSKDAAALALARLRLEVAECRVDAMQAIHEACDAFSQMENLSLQAYQKRRDLLNDTNPEQRATDLAALEALLKRIRAWENLTDNDIASNDAELAKMESRAAAVAVDDPQFSLLNEQRGYKNEKLTTLKRLSQAVVAQRKYLKRWVNEFTPAEEPANIQTSLTAAGNRGWVALKKIWNFELLSFEDNVVIQGQNFPVKFPVTLGMLLRALLFFLISYWIAARIARRVERELVGRGRLAEAQARTLRNWAMLVIGVFLAIGTLSVLKIPLTVFAFLGGALAIGLGFGMQTLIKNFISGIIVLAERKVRVGDILEIDGIVGTVTEINTRSSIIRSPDEVETMVPNSLFLENRVTNWTLSNSKIRRHVRVGVAYGTSTQQIIEVLTQVAGRHGLICHNPAPFVVLADFGDSALVFDLYFWLELSKGANAMIVTSDLRLMIEKRFTELGVEVPYPKRDLYLRSDSKLGVESSQQPS